MTAASIFGLRPLYTPRAFAAAIPSAWRSFRKLVSNSANTPSISRKALPAAVPVSIGCSVARNAARFLGTDDLASGGLQGCSLDPKALFERGDTRISIEGHLTAECVSRAGRLRFVRVWTQRPRRLKGQIATLTRRNLCDFQR